MRNRQELLKAEPEVLERGRLDVAALPHFPPCPCGCIEEAGVLFTALDGWNGTAVVLLDDIWITAEYRTTRWISTESLWKIGVRPTGKSATLPTSRGFGGWRMAYLSGSCADFWGNPYRRREWTDYRFTASLCPILGEAHRMNFRVQGCGSLLCIGTFGEKGCCGCARIETAMRFLRNAVSLGNWKMAFLTAGAARRGNRVLSEGKRTAAVHGWGCPLSQRLYRRFCSRAAACHYRDFIVAPVTIE